MSADQLQDSGHIQALDGVRGAAVLMVFAYHALSVTLSGSSALATCLLIKAGWLGVEVFFVLSGFLITTILLDTRESTNYYRVFYTRRALRIAPLYYLVVICRLLLGDGHVSYRTQAWYWLNLSNIPLAFGTAIIPYLMHFWSLGIEEQFYLGWPAVVRRLRHRSVALLCVGIVLGVLALKNLPLSLKITAHPDLFIYMFTPFRIDTLAAGALLAIAAKYWPARLTRSRIWLRLLLGSAFIVLAVVGIDNHKLAFIRFGYFAVTCGSCALIALALYPGSLTARIFSSSFLRHLGRYSYAMYLFHPFLTNAVCGNFGHVEHRFNVLFRRTVPQDVVALVTFVCEFGLVLGLSMVSWRYFEAPILRAKRHFRYWPRPVHQLA